MAEEITPRLGLDKYTSGSDPHPNRKKFNEARDKFEQLTAIAIQGAHSARPPAGKGGQLYCSIDQNNRVYFDNGTQWVEVSPVGGVAPGTIVAGGPAVEGTSHRAARADHGHSIPSEVLVSDSTISSHINGIKTGPAIDERIQAKVTPLVELTETGRLSETALSAAIVGQSGIQLWKTGTQYPVGRRVIMPTGDIMVSISSHTPTGPEPELSRWKRTPDAVRLRSRTHAEVERHSPAFLVKEEIDPAFLARWDVAPIFRAGDRFFTPWKASHERNEGGETSYFTRQNSASGNGKPFATVVSPVDRGATVTSITITPASKDLGFTLKLAFVYQGKLINEVLIPQAVQVLTGATTLTIPATTFPDGIPYGTTIVAPRGGSMNNWMASMNPGDTGMLVDKFFYWNESFTTPISQSMNLESLHDETVISYSSDHSWSALAGSGGKTFVTSSSPDTRMVVDLTLNTGYEYERVATQAATIGKPGTWHHEQGTPITVTPLDGKPIDNTKILCLVTANAFGVVGTASPIRVYLKNITIYGGQSGVLIEGPDAGVVTFTRDNVKVMWGGYGPRTAASSGDLTSGFRVRGNVISLAENSESAHSAHDAQSYTSLNGYYSRALEVESGGHSAGMFRFAESIIGNASVDNASTQHSGGMVLRIGGEYHNGQGSNVADVQEGTYSLNYGVSSFNSRSRWEGFNAGFSAQQPGVTMRLIGCRSWGNTHDLHAVEGATMTVTDTEFDTASGAQHMEIINPR